jgi:acetaldehyde dehydrogenase (acetylating)
VAADILVVVVSFVEVAGILVVSVAVVVVVVTVVVVATVAVVAEKLLGPQTGSSLEEFCESCPRKFLLLALLF